MRWLLSTAFLLVTGGTYAATASADESFYKALAEGGIAEVEAGKLAQERGADSRVRDFGAMMVKDHSRQREPQHPGYHQGTAVAHERHHGTDGR